jgi:leader peptidase (prepilin peptidase)/N-methyltransferase
MEIAGVVFFFVLGCVVGSFLNVLIWRLPRGIGINSPRRSFCPQCRHPIRWRDNIPLLSFTLLGGKCRDCRTVISWRYPAVELLTGLLFALLWFRQGALSGAGGGTVIVMALLASLLVVAGGVDIDWLIIPDEVSIFGLLGGLLAGLLLPELHVGAASYHTLQSLTGYTHLDGLIGSLIGAIGGGGLVFLFGLGGTLIFRKEALGFGDVKLMAMVGAFMGWKVVLLAFFLAPFFGLLYGIPLLISKDEHVMPYGPFLALASLIVMAFRTRLCAILADYLAMLGM